MTARHVGDRSFPTLPRISVKESFSFTSSTDEPLP